MGDFIVGTKPTAAYTRALNEGGRLVHVVELVDEAGERFLFTTDPRRTDAPLWAANPFDLVYDRAAQEQRSGEIVVPVRTDQVGSLVPSFTGHALHPASRNTIRMWSGYRLADGNDEMYRMATVDIEEIEVAAEGDSRELFLQYVDITDRLRVDFDTAGSISDGLSNVDVAVLLIEEILPPDLYPVNARTTTFTTPLIEYSVGDGRRELIDDLLDAVGYELTTDEYGQLNIGPISATYVHDGADPRWLYGDEEGAMAVSNPRLILGEFKPGGVTIKGGKISEDSDPIESAVYDKDPNSLTYYSPASSNVGAQFLSLDSDLILSVEQATLAGLAQLRGSRYGRGFVQFEAAPNPAMRNGDAVRFSSATVGVEAGMFTVESMSISPDADGSVMLVELRYTWDPSGALVDTGSAVLPAPTADLVTDDFDRPDEDLEGDDWIEHGQSWNVKDGQAIQAFAGSWCFARRVVPLETTNHRASVLIAAVPADPDPDITADTYAGPMIRSAGQFDGYAALVPSGALEVGLYKMQDSEISSQLGVSFSDGLTMEGRVIEIQAEGDSIVVRIDDVDRLSAIDSSFPGGTSVGFVGKGENWNNDPVLSPIVDDFKAGEAI